MESVMTDRQFILRKNYRFLVKGTILRIASDGNYSISGFDNIQYINGSISINSGEVENNPDIFGEIAPQIDSETLNQTLIDFHKRLKEIESKIDRHIDKHS
jgi:hypothetical protein